MMSKVILAFYTPRATASIRANTQGIVPKAEA